MNAPRALSRAAARQRWLDRVAEPLHRAVHLTFDALGGARRTQNALHGTWLGHPLHPLLTDATIGFLSSATLLDAASARGARRATRGADIAMGVGLLSSVGTAAAGLTDWQHTSGEVRRVGAAHAMANGGATLCYIASLALRLSGARPAARKLSYAGFGILSVGGYLGGTLVFDHRVGTSHAQAIPQVDRFTPVARVEDLREGQPHGAELDGLRLVLVRMGERLYALPAVCSHMGGPLESGTVEDCAIVCPWHGSRFDLASGAVIDGPSVYRQQPLDVRVRDGHVEVRTAVWRGPAGR